jgi:hydroxyacylglutathione hydrolase
VLFDQEPEASGFKAAAMSWPTIELEDTFGDCLKKALRGHHMEPRGLAQRTGIDAREIEAWTRDRGTASAEQARAIASVLRLDPEKFAERAAGTWYPPAIEDARVRQHSQAPHPSNGYVFVLPDGKRAALIDPAGNPAHLLAVLREGGYTLEYVLITHKHDDHCDAAGAIAAAYPDAAILMHPRDVFAIGALASRAVSAENGREVAFSDGTPIRVLHTPGHTDGSVCYLIDGVLFTGDILFCDSVGGAYGDASTYGDILESIASKIFSLPDVTTIMPGHGPPTTVALEKAHNPFF